MKSGEWGLVFVARGQFRGRFVYYDDEEDEGEAIIYLGTPRLSPAVRSLRLYRLH